VLAILVERTTGVPLARRERLGVAAAVAGLVLLGISLAGGSATGHHAAWPLVAAWVGGSLAVAAVAVGPLAARLTAGAGFGVAAGVLYAGGDVATKAAVVGGASLVFAAAVLGSHGLAFVALQLGFQRGSALATAGVSTLLTNALPIVAGMTIFGESLPSGALGALRVVAFAAVVMGAAMLARPGGDRSSEAATLSDGVRTGNPTRMESRRPGSGTPIVASARTGRARTEGASLRASRPRGARRRRTRP
jgi:hypothetical protein